MPEKNNDFSTQKDSKRTNNSIVIFSDVIKPLVLEKNEVEKKIEIISILAFLDYHDSNAIKQIVFFPKSITPETTKKVEKDFEKRSHVNT